MPAHRSRRHAVIQKLRSLDTPVLMCSYSQASGNNWALWTGRYITLRRANELVAGQEATRHEKETRNGKVYVYRESKATRSGSPTPCSLNEDTMFAAARSIDQAKGWKLDFEEQQQLTKYRVYAKIGDTKAVCVRPRMSERESALADKLLAKVKERVKRQPEGSVQALYFDAPAEVAA